ncbi:hypothetical protein AB1Y20_003368 [Prymnesium parvum]|uniref:Uncharacterized protein n=1 Tax=Prymnesium parvum TaxID=97485 RepID=A0AB34JDG0_PRYPA
MALYVQVLSWGWTPACAAEWRRTTYARSTHARQRGDLVMGADSASPTFFWDDTSIERVFWDEADLVVRSGPGGEGAIGFVGRRPAGGSGGAGGSVYLECSAAMNTLGHLRGRLSLRGERGFDGDARRTGRNGADAVLLVPPNCVVVDVMTNETLGKLITPGARLLLAEGGAGGAGNGEVWQRTRKESHGRTPPGGGTKVKVRLSMTLVADVGLVAYPNAGKSSLLRAVTRATPKVASYPFTTIVPNLGVCDLEAFGLGGDGHSMVWLDIPGLIDGASTGRGLGLTFLRHTERCRLLLHLIDGESSSPVEDYLAINKELEMFSEKLARTPQIVVLTKLDLPHVEARVPGTIAALKEVMLHKRIMGISSTRGDHLRELLIRTRRTLDQMNSAVEATRADRKDSQDKGSNT